MTESYPTTIGHYRIVKSLGKGGMGEVFLAFDPLCQRHVALKLIREELQAHRIMKERFLREAHVAAQLTHPSIVPILSIEENQSQIFYTMPFVEGHTLKEILKITHQEAKRGDICHPIGGSVPALTRIFLSVCEAIAYTHSKGILHRDLKPDNIIVGKYGEVLLLDWGLAEFIEKKERETPLPSLPSTQYKDLTRPGKVPGTLNYLAPERFYDHHPTVLVDIYSLGVILYQLLTLHLPFHRKTLQRFRKTMHLETWVDPLEIAPYRDIPQHLSDIAKKCLCFLPEQRFQSVDTIIFELKNFLEGKPEWIPSACLHRNQKEDWEFEENVLLTKHLAITRAPDIMEWVNLMVSKEAFSGNLKMETTFSLQEGSQGIGILFCDPPSHNSQRLKMTFCIFIGPHAYLSHHNIEIMHAQPTILPCNHLKIEKRDNELCVWLNQELLFRYPILLPDPTTHLGILCKDTHFDLDMIQVSLGSHNAMVHCLAIPDAFLGNKNYTRAFQEYRSIARSFAGRAEGREAVFRAGITLLEQATTQQKKQKIKATLEHALEEFGRLRLTPTAPLEYLGKSLVYKETKEIEEEIKCLELALRKYAKHPLVKHIRDQLLFRLHESALQDRIASYHFALLALRQYPEVFHVSDHSQLLLSLKTHLEPVPFLSPCPSEQTSLSIQLCFWLPKPIVALEMLKEPLDEISIHNIFYTLLLFGEIECVKQHLNILSDSKEILAALILFEKGPLSALQYFFETFSPPWNRKLLNCLYFLLDQALFSSPCAPLLPFFDKALPSAHSLPFEALYLAASMLAHDWHRATELISQCAPQTLHNEHSPLYPLFGCFLRYTEGEKKAQEHLNTAIDVPYPTTPSLLSYFLKGTIHKKKGWIAQAFWWEKIQLYRQLYLYYHCAHEPQKSRAYFRSIQTLMNQRGST